MSAIETGLLTVGALSNSEYTSRLSDSGLLLRIGPFNASIEAPIRALHEPLLRLYSDYPLIDAANVFNFRAKIASRRSWPRVYRRMVRFTVDGQMPHEDMPAEHALAVLEWGINLIVALRSHCYLILHSAVLEKNGNAMLLPAAPGFGKTTLCAALAHNRWRLLSDEFGMVRPGSLSFVPVPRPMALKNESINVIRSLLPDAILGPSMHGTRKGTVAHVKPPAESIVRQTEVATARWIVFPRWQKGAPFSLEPLSRAEGFMLLAMTAFNYELLGEAAFHTATDIVQSADCFSLVYSDLEEAIERLGELEA